MPNPVIQRFPGLRYAEQLVPARLREVGVAPLAALLRGLEGQCLW